MELVGYTEDDFDPWIESWEIKPITKQQARFNALESVK
jgi:hypothetical protein